MRMRMRMMGRTPRARNGSRPQKLHPPTRMRARLWVRYWGGTIIDCNPWGRRGKGVGSPWKGGDVVRELRVEGVIWRVGEQRRLGKKRVRENEVAEAAVALHDSAGREAAACGEGVHVTIVVLTAAAIATSSIHLLFCSVLLFSFAVFFFL